MSLKQFLRDNWQSLNCFYPVYREGANAVEFVLEGGRREICFRKINTVKQTLANIFSVDLEAHRQKYRELLDRSNSLPLVLHHQLVLVPVKTRTALTKYDGSWGYLVLAKYAACETKGAGSLITFQDGSEIESRFRRATVINYLQCGEACLSYYKKEVGIQSLSVREVGIPEGYVLVPLSAFQKLSGRG